MLRLEFHVNQRGLKRLHWSTSSRLTAPPQPISGRGAVTSLQCASLAAMLSVLFTCTGENGLLSAGKHISVQDTVICVCLSLLYACLVIHYRPSSVPIIYIINNSFAIRYITLQIWKYYGIFGFVLNERGRIHEHKAISKHSESAHGHCLGDFVFKCATHGIRCSSAGGYQTASHYCGRPLLVWGGIACIRCKASCT